MDDPEEVLLDFLDHLYLLLHDDWEHARDRCADPDYIAPTGTFLAPDVDDESNNWANRGAFLAAWRRFTAHVEWTPRGMHQRWEAWARQSAPDEPQA
jgi:hypothetical protein